MVLNVQLHMFDTAVQIHSCKIIRESGKSLFFVGILAHLMASFYVNLTCARGYL